jgi:ATP-dependent Clp endopeptidase proteolytic subunit ClpP
LLIKISSKGGERLKIDIKGAIIPNNDKWIYDWCNMDATCPNDVNKVIKDANGQAIEVFINSGGGDIFAGSEIFTSLKLYKGELKIHIVGLAASAASVIAMAGKSDISPTAMLMAHNVSSGTSGDYRDMSKMAETLKEANNAIANAYISKTGMSMEDVLKMMDNETWLSAQKAVDLGLVDNVMFENTQLVASYNSGMLPQEVINKIKNTVRNPQNNNVDFLLQAKAKLKLLNLKREIN